MKIRHLGVEKRVTPISMSFSHETGLWYLLAEHAGRMERFLLSEVQPVSQLADPSTTAISFIIPEHISDA